MDAWTKKGHRGYLLENLAIERVIRCGPNNFARAKLEASGFPLRFIWPIPGDLDGARALVDAVLDGDAPAIREAMAAHPGDDLGLRAHLVELEAKAPPVTARRVLRSRGLASGCRLDVELVRVADAAELRAVIRKGDKTLASRRLARRGIPK